MKFSIVLALFSLVFIVGSNCYRLQSIYPVRVNSQDRYDLLREFLTAKNSKYPSDDQEDDSDDDQLHDDIEDSYENSNKMIDNKNTQESDEENEEDDDDLLIKNDPRDQESEIYSSLLGGYQFVSGGAGEGQQHLKPDGGVQNKGEVKSDIFLPAYCNPPNPCPVGYKGEDCDRRPFSEFTAEYSKEFQS